MQPSPQSEFFKFVSRSESLLCEEHVYTVHINISISIEIGYALPLLPNNTASEIFLYKSEAVQNVDRIFITGAPAWR